MRKLDPQLEFLIDGGAADIESLQNEAVMGRFGFAEAESGKRKPSRAAKPAAAEVVVLVQFAGEPALLEKAGLTVRGIAGDIVTGSIPVDKIATLAEIGEVERVESARAMHPELDLSIVDCRANLAHVGPPGRRGAGVIVGIVDSGCDFTHPSFRRADGTSRILMIWDQGLTPQAGEASPAGFGYGVEYSNAQINAALVAANPFALVRHQDPPIQHGTHVTGIAAGDGSAPGQGLPGNSFVGVAPEADIIVVASASNGAEGLGTSANTLDAVNYIFQRAQARTQPCAINMSLGDNLGPHDGTSLLERGLDNLLGGPGRAFVKSAGNAGADRIHAEGNVATGATVNLVYNQPSGDASPNQIDLWYEGGDTFRISIVDPAGSVVGPVNVGTVGNFTLPGGNTVRVDHRNNDAFNGDRRVFMTFMPGTLGQMRAGSWTIRLVSVASPTGGRFDAWIQRGQVIPAFLAPHESAARTISTPGSASEVITAANYVTRGSGVGSLAGTSSRGPTRDGRAAPTVAAPGSTIVSAAGHFGTGDPYKGLGGTSMAAPHVTGTIALMFQKNPGRTQAQIKACLERTARTDAFTGPVPNTAWGHGKLDANAAVNCVPSPGAVRSVPLTTCPVASVVAICPSIPRTTCPVVSVVSGCPSVPRTTCPVASVITVCPSIPRTTCPVASLVTTCPASRVIACQPSVVTLCRSLPVNCQPSVVTVCNSVVCPSRAFCPSAIDGCPSTPGGCGVQSLACGGVQSLACGGGFPIPGLQPGPEGGEFVDESWEDAALQQPELPPEGFFEYDERWFDEDGQ